MIILTYKSYILLLCIVLILSVITIILYSKNKCDEINEKSIKETYIDNTNIPEKYWLSDPYKMTDGNTNYFSMPEYTTRSLTLGKTPGYKTTLNSLGTTTLNDAYFQGNVSIGSSNLSLNYDNIKARAEGYENFHDQLINIVYPIGSIYLTTKDINPNVQFKGTTWERIKNKFLMTYPGDDERSALIPSVSDSEMKPGAEGGSDTISIDALYPHTHTLPERVSTESGAHNHALAAYSNFDKNLVLDLDIGNTEGTTIKPANKASIGNKTITNISSEYKYYYNEAKTQKINYYPHPFSNQDYIFVFDEKHVLLKGNQNRVKTQYTPSNTNDINIKHEHDVTFDPGNGKLDNKDTNAAGEKVGIVGKGEPWFPPTICLYGWKRTA